uniref:Peptide hydrolase n=1 Tax=Schizophyllum commune (strain H4-8 / FGSC 9210) TaxID=578458 RepID=D8PVI5_SCHCM
MTLLVVQAHVCRTNPDTGLPQISEARILDVARTLSEDIGYRSVGTEEHAQGDAWMVDQARAFKEECDALVQSQGRALECEVWHQTGDGSHRFDIMGHRVYKTYRGLSNIIVRVSNGTAASKEHAVLVNSHLDSTLPSPGAADDALAVGVMLECMRVLLHTPGWEPAHAIIFLFNNAEESLQDGSHLYSTQHETRDTVRAVINLEAAGTTGREILFQATSEQMIEAYSHVPRPFGTVFANDIFSSGIILSDTDFGQFEKYLGVTGLDMAVIGNSYLYHMRNDLIAYIQPGVAQNMGENALALLHYLASSESPITTLPEHPPRPTTVYFSHLGRFWMYSFTTAKVGRCLRQTRSRPSQTRSFLALQARGCLAVVSAMLGALIGPTLVAFTMRLVLNRGLSWFANEYSPILLYGPAAFLGALVSQKFVPTLGADAEHTLFGSVALLQGVAALGIQLLGVGSGALFFLTGLPLLMGYVANAVVFGKYISLLTYAWGAAFTVYTGTLLIMPTLEVFVPLTGRMGHDAPADNVIAVIVGTLTAYASALVLPFVYRFEESAGPKRSTGFLRRARVFAALATVVSVAYFAARSPFDATHQKRVFMIHMENVTSGEHKLHIGGFDPAPDLEILARDIATALPAAAPETTFGAVDMTPYNSDWNSIYPVSAFLSPYAVTMDVAEGYVSPWVKEDAPVFYARAVRDERDEEAGTRALTLEMYHPGLIWSVIAFDAEVLSWDLDNDPPAGRTRHHIKEASFHGVDKWEVELVVRDEGDIIIDYVGIQEDGIWPARKARFEAKGGADSPLPLRMFDALDAYIIERTAGAVDAMFLGCVSATFAV